MDWASSLRSITIGAIAACAICVNATTAYSEASPEGVTLTRTGQSLWISNATRRGIPFVSEISASSLSSSGTPRAAMAFTFYGSHGRPGIAFDSSHNLWMAFCNNNLLRSEGPLVELTPKQLRRLAQHQRVQPAVIIDYVGISLQPLNCPIDLKFDASGDLWVLNSGVDGIYSGVVEFTPFQLAQSGSPVPATEIIWPDLIMPIHMEFDSAGNLWVADFFANAVFEFTASQVAAGGTLTPNITLQPAEVSFLGGIAFDGNGNLWVGYEYSTGPQTPPSLLLFAASDLVGSGLISPTPIVTITPAKVGKRPAFQSGDELEFDPKGNLWISTSVQHAAPTGRIVKFTPAQIAASGDPIPKPILNSDRRKNFVSPGKMVFGPTIP